MTVEEYNQTKFTGGMWALVNEKWHLVAAADFGKKTFGLLFGKSIKWFSYESVKEVKYV